MQQKEEASLKKKIQNQIFLQLRGQVDENRNIRIDLAGRTIR